MFWPISTASKGDVVLRRVFPRRHDSAKSFAIKSLKRSSFREVWSAWLKATLERRIHVRCTILACGQSVHYGRCSLSPGRSSRTQYLSTISHYDIFFRLPWKSFSARVFAVLVQRESVWEGTKRRRRNWRVQSETREWRKKSKSNITPANHPSIDSAIYLILI